MFLILFFHLICQDIQRFRLGDPRTFHYLNQSNCYELDGVDDSKEYIATRRAMDIVGISSDEQVFPFSFFRSYSTLAINFAVVNALNFLLFIQLCFIRMQYFELWLQFSILEMLNLQKGRRLTHRFPKMKNLGSI